MRRCPLEAICARRPQTAHARRLVGAHRLSSHPVDRPLHGRQGKSRCHPSRCQPLFLVRTRTQLAKALTSIVEGSGVCCCRSFGKRPYAAELLAYRYNRTDPEIPPALEYSSVTVRGTCPMLGGVLMLACLLMHFLSSRPNAVDADKLRVTPDRLLRNSKLLHPTNCVSLYSKHRTEHSLSR